MSIKVKDFTYCRKIFFIAPDTTIFPESYLEEYFALGYEVYFVENEQHIDLKTKVRYLFSLFDDAVFFFNVDAVIPGVNWVDFISELSTRCRNMVSIGVFYTKKTNKEMGNLYARKYLYEIGVTAGCIQLEYQKKLNLMIIERVLFANQAKGRRQNIRALCTKDYNYSFIKDDITFTGSLQDISLSHFSLMVPDDDKKLVLEVGDKIPEFHFFLNGLLFRSPVIMMMKRKSNEATLYVFAYMNETGAGLNPRYKQQLAPNLYRLMTTKLKQIIELIHKLDSEQEFDPRTIGDMAIE